MSKRRIIFFSLLLIPLLLWCVDYLYKFAYSQNLGLDVISLILVILIIFLLSWDLQQNTDTISQNIVIFESIKNKFGPSIIITSTLVLILTLGFLSYTASKFSNPTQADPLNSTIDIGSIQTAAIETAFAQMDSTPDVKHDPSVGITTNPDESVSITTTNPLSTVIPTNFTTQSSNNATTQLTLTENDPQNTEITPVETDLPEPIDLTGSGNDDVNFSKWDGPAVVSVTHDGDGTFELSNYSKTSQKISTLVTTSGFYVGSLALDFIKNQKSTYFHIIASGDWEIQIIPLALARVENIPALIEGDGDDVIEILDTNPDQLQIDASLAEGPFTMWAFDKNTLTLLIRTTAPYTGTLIAPPGTTTIVVTTIGPWSMDTTSK